LLAAGMILLLTRRRWAGQSRLWESPRTPRLV